MSYSKLETMARMEEQLALMKSLVTPVVGVNKVLSFIGFGSKRLEDFRLQMKKLEHDLHELKTIPVEFNKIFSDRGWIAYSNLNLELMREMIEISKRESVKAAEQKILDHYKPESIENVLYALYCVPQINIRRRLIELAFIDYVAERYHAVIPVLLMMIDGIVNDVASKGFHSDQTDLDVWDSILGIDNGIDKIKTIFCKGRKRTREEDIDLPYRNGILHGMDIGYDNYVVAAKCWNFLFVIKDWVQSKQSEEARMKKFEEENCTPTWSELCESLEQNRITKKAFDDWKPRTISSDFIKKVNERNLETGTLEDTVIKFLKLWTKKNYGDMAKMKWSIYSHNSKPDFTGVREQFSNLKLKSYTVEDIYDEGPAISEIIIGATMEDESEVKFKMRMIYEKKDGRTTPRIMANGIWKVVWVQDYNEDTK